jgi:hypothetical protein
VQPRVRVPAPVDDADDTVERFKDLRARDSADAELTHLSQLALEFALDVGPGRTGGRIGVRLCLATIEFGGEGRRDGGGGRGIKTVPETTHQRDALLRRERVNRNRGRGHTNSLSSCGRVRNSRLAEALTIIWKVTLSRFAVFADVSEWRNW